MATTYEVDSESATWASAEVWAWSDDLTGRLVAVATLVPGGCTVRMDDGRSLPGVFASPAAAVEAVRLADRP